MTSIVFITSSFPYEGGEQFIEAEINFWAHTRFKNVYLLPHSRPNGVVRSYPKNIKILNKYDKKSNTYYVIKALVSSFFLKELLYIITKTNAKHILSNSFYALKAVAHTLREKERILLNIKDINDDVVVYTYWNTSYSYAATLLKDKKLISKVFSRSHGHDLYEYEKPNNYMPLKRQFINKFDRIFFLSKHALIYFQETYKPTSDNLSVSPLGVKIPSKKINQLSKSGRLTLLSLSNCHSIKQIDRILSSLEEYASLNEDLEIVWNHIGDGPLKTKLVSASSKVMKNNLNIKINFLGSYTNSQVHEHLSHNYYDFIINTSRSEGIPVSLMEAMSYGIPAIAPNVGGILNLVNNDNGVLLPANFSNQNIIEAIDKIINDENIVEKRLNARNHIISYYSSNKNYSNFVKKIELLGTEQ